MWICAVLFQWITNPLKFNRMLFFICSRTIFLLCRVVFLQCVCIYTKQKHVCINGVEWSKSFGCNCTCYILHVIHVIPIRDFRKVTGMRILFLRSWESHATLQGCLYWLCRDCAFIPSLSLSPLHSQKSSPVLFPCGAKLLAFIIRDILLLD